MGKVLGLDCKLYYNAAGNETPIVPGNWTELTNCKDVTLNLESSEADVTTRANSGWRATAAALKDGSIEFEMVWDTADAGFTAIQTAFNGKTNIGILALDGSASASGSQGLAAEMVVTSFSRNEPLEEAVTVSVTLKPAYATVAPYWHTVP